MKPDAQFAGQRGEARNARAAVFGLRNGKQLLGGEHHQRGVFRRQNIVRAALHRTADGCFSRLQIGIDSCAAAHLHQRGPECRVCVAHVILNLDRFYSVGVNGSTTRASASTSTRAAPARQGRGVKLEGSAIASRSGSLGR